VEKGVSKKPLAGAIKVWSLIALALAAGLVACGSDSRPSPAATPSPTLSLVEARPYGFLAPASYRSSTPTPLVITLHGYGSNGRQQAEYFGLPADAEEHGYLLAYPDGLVDARGSRFWNATDACCNFYGNPVNDVAYLGAVIDDVAAHYTVDPKRVFVIGHSNGGFMAHRVACEIGGRIAAIISLAGATWRNPANCPAASLVNVLQVHGDADQTISYVGNGVYPSAPETVAIWAQKNGCVGALEDRGADKDLDLGITGRETRTESYAGCPPGGAADLWTIAGGGHIPNLGSSWADEAWAYFSAHAKP
jgi:polyhydroxybutyrate depolymerase